LLPVNVLMRSTGWQEAHVPDQHVSPAAHALPQPPQFAGSVCSFVHAPPHAVVPGAHAHLPFWHVSRAEHAASHPPPLDAPLPDDAPESTLPPPLPDDAPESTLPPPLPDDAPESTLPPPPASSSQRQGPSELARQIPPAQHWQVPAEVHTAVPVTHAGQGVGTQAPPLDDVDDPDPLDPLEPLALLDPLEPPEPLALLDPLEPPEPLVLLDPPLVDDPLLETSPLEEPPWPASEPSSPASSTVAASPASSQLRPQPGISAIDRKESAATHRICSAPRWLTSGCSSHRDALTRGFGGALCGLSAMTFASTVTSA
jgi:hypothetical protein